MTTNQATGGLRSATAFSQGRRQRNADSRRRRSRTAGAARTPPPPSDPPSRLSSKQLALQLLPGLYPLVVVRAVLLAVAAVGNRRLPELEGPVVRQRLVG